MEKLERSPVCQRLPLRSFLVLPFQRITRIKLLVQVCLSVCVHVCVLLMVHNSINPAPVYLSLTHTHCFCPEHCEENYSWYCRGDSGHQIFETSGEGTAASPFPCTLTQDSNILVLLNNILDISLVTKLSFL